MVGRLKRWLVEAEQPDFSAHVKRGREVITSPLFRLDVRSPVAGATNLWIGDEAFLHCSVVAEREGAQVRIGRRTFIGHETKIIAADRIDIGDDVNIAWAVTVTDHNAHSVDWAKRASDTGRARADYLAHGGNVSVSKDWSNVGIAPVVIADRAWIGFNAIILKGVTVGEGAVVGAGSVVTKDVPPNTIVAGNPARVVRELRAEEHRGDSEA